MRPLKTVQLFIPDPDTMASCAASLASQRPKRLSVALEGPLGAGKTLWATSFIRALGVEEALGSPTYPIVLNYEAGGQSILHVDAYRLSNDQALWALGFEDLWESSDYIFLEWPSRVPFWGAQADICITFTCVEGTAHRTLSLTAQSSLGISWLSQIG